MTAAPAEFGWPDEEEAEPAELTTETFACPDCEANFDSEADLAFHRSQLHPFKPIPTSYQCPVCELEFPTQEQLNTHGQFDHPAP